MSRNQRRLAQKKNKQASGGRKALSSITAQKLFNDALKAFQQGSLKDASHKADQLIASIPDSAQLYQLRGMIELNQKNFSGAVEYYRKGLSAEPNSAALCDLLGTALSELGQFDDAISSYRRALLNDTRNAGTLNNLGMVLQKKEDWEKSEKAFRDSSPVRRIKR